MRANILVYYTMCLSAWLPLNLHSVAQSPFVICTPLHCVHRSIIYLRSFLLQILLSFSRLQERNEDTCRGLCRLVLAPLESHLHILLATQEPNHTQTTRVGGVAREESWGEEKQGIFISSVLFSGFTSVHAPS